MQNIYTIQIEKIKITITNIRSTKKFYTKNIKQFDVTLIRINAALKKEMLN